MEGKTGLGNIEIVPEAPLPAPPPLPLSPPPPSPLPPPLLQRQLSPWGEIMNSCW